MIITEIKKSINIKIVIALILVGIIMLFSNAHNFIGELNTIEQKVMKESTEKGLSDLQLQKVKYDVDKHIESYGNSYMAWRFSIFGYEIVCILLATSVYAYSYRIDKKSGMLKNILLRTNRKKYYLTKYIINAISGGFIVIIPVIIVTIFFMAKFGVSTLPTLEAYFPHGFMSSYFQTHPITYILFFTAILFFIGVAYSTFAMAIAIVSKNMVSSILIPLIYWFGGSLIAGALNLYYLSPWNIYYFYADELYSFRAGVIHTLIIFILSSILIYTEVKKENI